MTYDVRGHVRDNSLRKKLVARGVCVEEGGEREGGRGVDNEG